MTTCKGCASRLPVHVDRCPSCFKDAGAPNVRSAEEPTEQAALARRLDVAEADAAARGAGPVLSRFREAVRGSLAVLCRPLAQVTELASSDNALYATFYQLVHAGVRSPEDNVFDRVRESVDSNLFPLSKDQIRFAALSIDGKGPDGF